jgi:hypothetical protein
VELEYRSILPAGLASGEHGSYEVWLERLARSNTETSAFEALGDRHFAYCQKGSRRALLVTFESIPRVRREAPDGVPRGLTLGLPWGWSSLVILSGDDTWFRDQAVFDYFDDLAAAGYFEAFDRVVFYGAGPSAAYAATAFSVAAPGAVVIAISPQATLDTTIASWDDRFPELRRTSFKDRYGYAPDMLQAADRAFILFDPASRLDSIHATLFRSGHVHPVPMRGLGPNIEGELISMGILSRILGVAAAGSLNAPFIAKLYRKRRNHGIWLNALAQRLTHRNRPWLTAIACRSILRRYPSSKLEKLYDQSMEILRRQGRTLPPSRAPNTVLR